MIENYYMYKNRGPFYSTNRKVSRYLENASLSDYLNDPSQEDLTRLLLKAKSDELFSILETKIGSQELNDTLAEFFYSHIFQNCMLDDLVAMLQRKYDINLENLLSQWYTSNTLPGYVITDRKHYLIEHNNRTYQQVRFTIHNPEPVDGIVLVRGRENNPDSNEWTHTYHSIIKGNQSKEIGLIFDSKPELIEISTLLSQNIPNRITMAFRENVRTENTPLFDGERVVDNDYVYEQDGEIIADNVDPGFQIVKNKPKWQLLQSFFPSDYLQKQEQKQWIFRGYRSDPVETWTSFSNDSFFGLYAKTAHMISGGKGNHKVRWTANLPDEGEYDLYCYTYYYDLQKLYGSSFEKRLPHLKGTTTIAYYTFLVYLNNRVEQITREISNYVDEPDRVTEIHIGTFNFSKGPATVELTDETNGLYVFADAVKWVKRK